MLYELKNVYQNEKGIFRRIFVDEYFDLYLWFENGEIIGFQLCYNKKKEERSLTWRENFGYVHDKVDSGDITGGFKMKPVLVSDGLFNSSEISAKFKKASLEIDKDIADFVSQKLELYK